MAKRILISVVLFVALVAGLCSCHHQRPAQTAERETPLQGEPIPPPFAYPFIPSLADAQEVVKNYPHSAIAHYELGRAYHALRDRACLPRLERLRKSHSRF